MQSICGVDCQKCGMKTDCGGCKKTKGQPFGGDCIIAKCHEKKACKNCIDISCNLKETMIAEFNALKIAGMPKIDSLNALPGVFVNMEYSLNGQKIKLLDDKKIYLGNQVEKKNSNRCYGLAGDENYLLVCEYGENGIDPEIVVFKKR